MVDKIEYFIYVFEMDDIFVILKGYFSIYRKLIFRKGLFYFLMSFDCDLVFCMDYDEVVYFVVVLKCVFVIIDKKYDISYYICIINDIGCYISIKLF